MFDSLNEEEQISFLISIKWILMQADVHKNITEFSAFPRLYLYYIDSTCCSRRNHECITFVSFLVSDMYFLYLPSSRLFLFTLNFFLFLFCSSLSSSVLLHPSMSVCPSAVCASVWMCIAKCEGTQGLGHGGFNTPLTLHVILFLSSLTSNTISKYRLLSWPSSSKNIPALLPLSLPHPFWPPGFMFYVVVVFLVSHLNTNNNNNKKKKKT